MDMSQEFGERLVRIEGKVDGIIERLDKINGAVGRHDDVIGKIQTRCAAHDAMKVSETRAHDTLDEWRSSVEGEMKSFKTWIDNATGRTSGYGQIATAILSLVTLTLVMYQTAMSHQAAHPPPAAQHQAK